MSGSEAYSFGADAGPWDPVNSPNNRYNSCFGRVYQTVDNISRQNAPPGLTGLGLIAVNPQWDFLTSPNNAMVLRPSGTYPSGGYIWDVVKAQRSANNMTQELTLLYGTPKSPDVYMFQFWNANAADLGNNLWTLINSNGGDPSRMTIPANLIFPVEFGTSSSGTGADSWGDAQTQTTTANGLNNWLTNTLCTFRSQNIVKYAYWSMYDPTTFWVNSPWYYYGQALWWNGYWGLGWEYPPSGFKTAWNTFNQSPGSLYCPATPSPNLNTWTLSDYVWRWDLKTTMKPGDSLETRKRKPAPSYN